MTDKPPRLSGNRVFSGEELLAMRGPHPYAHWGDEIRARISDRRKGKWWERTEYEQAPPKPNT